MGGKFLLKLNTGERPIAYKYREGKMKRTLKRELKVLETVEGYTHRKRRLLGLRLCGLGPHYSWALAGQAGFYHQENRAVSRVRLRSRSALILVQGVRDQRALRDCSHRSTGLPSGMCRGPAGHECGL